MIAFLREVSPHLARCELTHLPRRPINVERARRQHHAYAVSLNELGVTVETLPALPQHPDGVFVEDTAILLPEVAIITRPGAPSREKEVEATAPILAQYRPVQRIVAGAILDGGDVLRIGHTLFVAASTRTNREGIYSLQEIVAAFGYEVKPVEIKDCVHLKTACTFIPPNFLLVNPAWVQPAVFGDLVRIEVDKKEPFAANTLTIAGTTLVNAACPRTDERLKKAGIITQRVEISEFEKAEAGLTCLSIVLEPRTRRAASVKLGLKPIQVASAPLPAGHWSQAIVHGGLVYVSAQPPIDPKERKLRRRSVEAQTEQALRNVAAVLGSASSSLAHVLRATLYLSDAKHLAQVEPAYAKAFDSHRPTRAVIVNKGLPAGVAVMIEVVAAVADTPTE
jgi:dimethylargininase